MTRRTAAIIKHIVVWVPLVVLVAIGIWACPTYNDAVGTAAGWLSAGLFSIGVASAGLFSIGIFSAGVFSIGVFSFGTFVIGLWAAGQFACGRFVTEYHRPKEAPSKE